MRALAYTQSESLILERPEATIRWLVMWGQWPYASLAMVERFDAQLDEWKGEIPEDQLEVDALPLLLARVAPTLDSRSAIASTTTRRSCTTCCRCRAAG